MLLSVFLRGSLARRRLNCLSSYSLSLQVRVPRSTVQLLSEIPRSCLKSRGGKTFFSSGPLICGSVFLDQIETLLKIHSVSRSSQKSWIASAVYFVLCNDVFIVFFCQICTPCAVLWSTEVVLKMCSLYLNKC